MSTEHISIGKEPGARDRIPNEGFRLGNAGAIHLQSEGKARRMAGVLDAFLLLCQNIKVTYTRKSLLGLTASEG